MKDLNIEATYSVEDNKLRLYAAERLPKEVYERVKGAGFVWAPRQELFVAPCWTPEREDLCLELAGDIGPEDTTLAERAEAKAYRLANLADKRERQADAFSAAARRMLDRMTAGQPILIGHHSERRHRNELARVDRQQELAVKAGDAVGYWLSRATSVVRHANRKNKQSVRQGRIKNLLAELRDLQRDINHGHMVVELWTQIGAIADLEKRNSTIRRYVGVQIVTGSSAPFSTYSQLDKGEITHDEALLQCLKYGEAMAGSVTKARWIQHTLNRLAYERSELGPVEPFGGSLTEVIIKAFARENGAHKPDCVKSDGGFTLKSDVPLPLHLVGDSYGDGKTLTLTEQGWCELMLDVGYEVPEPKDAAPPILNFEADAVMVQWHGVKTLKVMRMSKDQFQGIYSDYRGVKVSACGRFRVRICKNPNEHGWSASWVVVHLTDSKKHPVPDSDSVCREAEEACRA